MSQAKDFVTAPVSLLQAEAPLQITIYLYMPLNQKFVLVRKKGDILPLQELMSILKQADRVFTLREEYQQEVDKISGIISSGITSRGTSPEVKKFASDTIKKMSTIPKGQPHLVQGFLKDTTKIVDQVIANFKKISNAKAYYEYLLSLNRDDTPLSRHQKHVCALTVLVKLTIDNSSSDELTDNAFAANAHDLCLPEVSMEMQSRHLEAQEVAMQSLNQHYYQKMVEGYEKHIDGVIKKLSDSGIEVPEMAKKIILQHHENYDGTGLYGIKGDKLFRSAALLRVVDDLVCLINCTTKPMSLLEAFENLEEINQTGYRRLYHPEILKEMRSKMFGKDL